MLSKQKFTKLIISLMSPNINSKMTLASVILLYMSVILSNTIREAVV